MGADMCSLTALEAGKLAPVHRHLSHGVVLESPRVNCAKIRNHASPLPHREGALRDESRAA